jgi:hypothetical protein
MTRRRRSESAARNSRGETRRTGSHGWHAWGRYVASARCILAGIVTTAAVVPAIWIEARSVGAILAQALFDNPAALIDTALGLERRMGPTS